MGLDLNTALISDTFDGLIKTTDGNTLTGSPLVLTDGRGNNSSLALATAGNGVTITGTLTVGGVDIGGDLATAQSDITAIETKTDFITVTGAVNLDTIKTKADFITVTQAVDLDTIESDIASATAKTQYITVTQAVNLDTMESDILSAKTKTDFITISQAVNLDNVESGLATAEADIIAIEAKTDFITVSGAVNLNTIKTKTDFITVTQAVNLDTIESGLSQAQTDINLIEAKTNNITVTQAVNLDTMESNIATNNAKNSYPAGDATKVGFISVTQAVDLDSMETDISNLSANKYDKTGGTISGAVTITGDLTVNGTTTTVNTQTLSVKDPLIELANDNSANSVDTGFYANYSEDAGVTTKYAGLFKDAGDSDKFKLFKGLEVEPTTTVNTAGTGYTKGDLVVNDLDAVTISGTLSTAAQPNITSVGTLSSLAVSGNLTVDTNTLFVDAANNEVGIGTATPERRFHVNSASTQIGSLFESTSAVSTQINIKNANSTNGGFIKTTGNNIILTANGSTLEHLVVADGGNVGIGESNPASLLHLASNNDGGNNNVVLRFEDTDGNTGNNQPLGQIQFYGNDGSGAGQGIKVGIKAFSLNNVGESYLTFSTSDNVSNDQERMRIDSSGNVGIGTASPSRPLHVNSGETNGVALFESTDQFAQVSIQDSFAKTDLIHNVGQFQIEVDPDNVGGASSLIIDIDGSEKLRVLSGGGITFNGDTAAANALDDYEEGSWTPVYEPTTGSFATMTMDILNANYTKIGRLVTIVAQIRTDDVDVTGGSGNVLIGGLPYTVVQSSGGGGAISVGYTSGFVNAPTNGGFTNNGTTIILRVGTTAMAVADLTDGTSANENTLYFAASYFTS